MCGQSRRLLHENYVEEGCSQRRQWLYRIADKDAIQAEILATVSMALHVRIAVVPPKRHQKTQVCPGVEEYPQPDDGSTVYLATDDVHYVWLRP